MLPPLETELRDAIIKAISCHAQEFLTNDENIATLTDLLVIAIVVLKEKVDENVLLELQLQRMRVRGRY
jgi:hypothetical protein